MTRIRRLSVLNKIQFIQNRTNTSAVKLLRKQRSDGKINFITCQSIPNPTYSVIKIIVPNSRLIVI